MVVVGHGFIGHILALCHEDSGENLAGGFVDLRDSNILSSPSVGGRVRYLHALGYKSAMKGGK